MISVIISTYQANFLNALKDNIAKTIGVPYEIIEVNNPNLISICEAYNVGATNARFPYLCFLHEDLLIKSNYWGKTLIGKFEIDELTGLIGVAGTKYKSLAPGGWGNLDNDTDRINIIQHFRDQRQSEHHHNFNNNFEDVVCVDGVFLFTKKSIWGGNKFDQDTFKHFHCYDLDFSLSIGQHYKVLVTNSVLVEHFSPGGMDDKWINETIKLSEKWKKKLPIGSIDKKKKTEIEWKQKKWTIEKMIIYNQSFNQVLNIFFGFGFFKFFSFKKSATCFKMILVSYKNRITCL